MTILFEEDGWIIFRYDTMFGPLHGVKHHVDTHKDVTRILTLHCNDPCTGCGQPVPDSIQALFRMLQS